MPPRCLQSLHLEKNDQSVGSEELQFTWFISVYSKNFQLSFEKRKVPGLFFHWPEYLSPKVVLDFSDVCRIFSSMNFRVLFFLNHMSRSQSKFPFIFYSPTRLTPDSDSWIVSPDKWSDCYSFWFHVLILYIFHKI